MSKKSILSKHSKKLIAFLLVCLITISLTGCDSSNKKPTGDLDLNATYASTTDFSVSVGDVYNKIRYNAVGYVENEVYKFLYKDEIAEVEKDPSKYEEEFHHAILHDVYEIHDEDAFEDLDEDAKELAVKKYADKMYQKGYKLEDTDIDNIVDGNFEAVKPYYYLEVAKSVAAKNSLTEEVSKDFTFTDGKISAAIDEVTDETYFTKDEVVSYYENNYENTGNVDAILIRFINNNEAKNVLKKFGLKESGGKLYQIKLDESKCKTEKDYNDYYSKYSVKLTGEDSLVSIDEQGYGKSTVLKVYAAIYNYIYTYRDSIDIVDSIGDIEAPEHLKYYYYIQNIVTKDEANKNTDIKAEQYNPQARYNELVEQLTNPEKPYAPYITMDKERLDKYSSSLANYLYTSLKTEADEEGKAFTQYLASAKSYGSYYYLLFKINEHSIEDEKDNVLYEEKEVDGKTVIEFKNQAFLNKILNEMFEEEIDDTYVEEKFTERVKEAKLKIYDSIVETQFMYSSTSSLVESYEKNKKKNNDVIAEVTYKKNTHKITVKDAFSYLEPLYGPQLASNLLFQQYIKTTDYYTSLEKDYDNYVETVKLMLYYFANDYYAQSGYPSSIGKYNFMMLYYGTANVDEVVKDFLMVSDATNKFFNDFAKDNNEFYTNLLGYATKTYNDFYSLTVSGLTVYVDRDEDGVADEMTDTTVLAKANELLEVAYDYVTKSNAAYSTALNNVVSAFNSSSRIESTNPTSPEYDWAAYRSLGLHIEVSSFGTFTDTTVTKEEAIKNRVAELYDVVVDSKLGFTSAYLDSETLETSDNKLTKLLVTAGALPTSAKYETENEEESKLYESVNVIINDKKETINLTYTTDEITLAQVKVYVAEHLLLGDVYSLPATTIAALDAYLLPLINKYTGSASQMTLTNNTLGTITFSYTGTLSTSFNEAFAKDYSRSTFYSNYISILQNAEDKYEEVYTGWWNNMYKGGSN